MLYWVERIASHVRVASMIIGQKDSSVCFVLNQEPNMIVQQPLFFSTTHRDNGTRLCWVREVSTAIIIIKKRDNDNAMEPGPGQGITGDNATETFALILAASVLCTTMLRYIIHQHPQWYLPTSPSTTRNLCFSKLLPPAHEYLHICTPWIGRARVSSKIVLTFWHLSFEQCVRFPVGASCDMKSCSH